MNVDVFVLGKIVVDARFEISDWLKEGKVHFTDNFSLEPGGKTLNATITASNLGANTSIIGFLGDDFIGKFTLNFLKQRGINIDYIKVSQMATPLVNVISTKKSITYIVGNSPISTKMLEQLYPERIDINRFSRNTTLLANLGMSSDIVRSYFSLAKKCGGITILNPVPPQNVLSESENFWKNVDYLIPNIDEAKAILGITNSSVSVRDLAYRLKALGASNVCITMGDRGSYVVNSYGEGFEVPIHRVRSIDPTGASDAFCGTLAMITHENPFKAKGNIWEVATAAAAIACTKTGSALSMPSLDELRHIFN